MYLRIRQKYISIGLFIVVVISLLVFFIPFFMEVKLNSNFLASILNNNDGFYDAIIRSFIVATYQSILIVLISTIVAFFLINIPFYSTKSQFLSLLIIPILIGNVSSAFIWKILLKGNSYFFTSDNHTFLGMMIIQFWQYGTLFVYLIWLNLKSIEKGKLEYTSVYKLSLFEKIRDLYLPKSLNLSILLFIICFIFCLFEDAKIFFIFKASRGTNTELINQWFNRTYQSNSLINPDYAFQFISSAGFIILLLSVIVLFLLVLIKNLSINKFVRIKHLPLVPIIGSKFLSSLILVLLISFALIPILMAWIKQDSILSFNNTSNLRSPIFLTFIASIFSTFVAILFGLISRLIFRKTLSSFNRNSVGFLIFLFVLMLIPSICLLLMGFKWMKNIGYSSEFTPYIVWIIGHSILCLPLLGGFSIVTHFKVKNNHLEYLESHRSTFLEIIKDIFINPFRSDYILTFIIAFSLIWNESIINKVLSDIIPSFVTEINKTILGRSADYSKGMSFLFISILLAISFVLIWNRMIKKHKDEKYSI